jgi:hypothetical protein
MKKVGACALGSTVLCTTSRHHKSECAPIDVTCFTRYCVTAVESASMEGPVPAKDRVTGRMHDSSGSVLTVVFGDDPLSRVMIAIRCKAREDQQVDKVPAISARIHALIHLIESGFLHQWAGSTPQDPLYLCHLDAMIFAAAVSPLNDDFMFQMDQFERLVELRLAGIDPG